MLFILFISSGLFLGWSLGANDAANIFGTAVGSKMVSFIKAAWIASIFVVLGAVFQGRGATDTLTELGSVDALGGAFTVALCAGITVLFMTRMSLPVSTSQSIVGAIVGWSVFTGHKTDLGILSEIIGSWISGPLLGMLFAALLFLLTRYLLRRLKLHIIKLDSVLRIGLIVVGAFGAYSLGANNIANVMGVFVAMAPEVTLDFGLFTMDGVQVLFLIGGLAIAAGIFTYSKKVMLTVGKEILALTPEAALVVVLTQAIVLFLFSSRSFSAFLGNIGLPAIPLVPVSSTQVVVGAVLGIGLIKGGREIRFRTLGGIGLGWISTPLAAGILTWFALFFIQNVFGLEVTSSIPSASPDNHVISSAGAPAHDVPVFNLVLPSAIILASVAIILLILMIFRQQKLRLQAENQFLQQLNENYASNRSLNELEINTVQMQNSMLTTRLELKRQQLNNILLNISDQKNFLDYLTRELSELIGVEDTTQRDNRLRDLVLMMKQKKSFSKEMDEVYSQIEQVHQNFYMNLSDKFPDLTDNEKKLAMLIRLNLASKEIATLMNISAKSVDIARYRLRRKLGLQERESLTEFMKSV
ncbi:MAG TPA: inorganic phosphate transporter [Bacteroidales bacterium]|nr:inorganic phosphate transporter [Bacteroidales bacterium]HRZ49979.1 inorganic phosphate transporter [Bacteroidales bacterium]